MTVQQLDFKDLDFATLTEPEQNALTEIIKIDQRDTFAYARSMESARIQSAIDVVKASEAYKARENSIREARASEAAAAEAKRVEALKDELYIRHLAEKGGS